MLSLPRWVSLHTAPKILQGKILRAKAAPPSFLESQLARQVLSSGLHEWMNEWNLDWLVNWSVWRDAFSLWFSQWPACSRSKLALVHYDESLVKSKKVGFHLRSATGKELAFLSCQRVSWHLCICHTFIEYLQYAWHYGGHWQKIIVIIGTRTQSLWDLDKVSDCLQYMIFSGRGQVLVQRGLPSSP